MPDIYLHNFEVRTHKLVILVVATTGEGDATDNARKFNRFITSKGTPGDAFVGLKYTVFGLGDLNYINFNQMGKRTEINMDRLGAQKIYPRGIGDASQDIEADLRKWIDGGLIEAVRENVPNLTRTGSKPVIVLNSGLPDLMNMVCVKEDSTPNPSSPSSRARGMSTLSKVFWTLSDATITGKEELRQLSDDRTSTCEIKLKLSENFEACDSIEILPHNSTETVNWLTRFLGAESLLDETIDFESSDAVRKLPFPTPCTVRTALTYFIDATSCPTKTLLSNLAVLNRGNSDVEEALFSLAGNSTIMKELSNHMVSLQELMDLLEDCLDTKIKISLSEFLQIGPKQRARAYTIASAPPGNEAKLVVSLTSRELSRLDTLVAMMIEAGIVPNKPYQGGERKLFKGLCSKYLCQEAKIGDLLKVRVRESVLRPPRDLGSLQTVVAVVAGAGIAPVMAYLDACGKEDNWPNLFYVVFGCKSSSKDFLYKERILELQQEGKIRCWFAFSSEGPKKVYVQDLVRETREIHKIIHEIHLKNGRILICGSTAMGRSVCEAVASQIGGQAILETLEKSGRLVVEYFG
jgi:NADPH-ferrihemoprotein reductase